MGISFRRKHGFSLVEALVALTLIGLASSTLLLATASTVQSGSDVLAQTIARGIAEQLLDEILGQPYCEPGKAPTDSLGRESGESTTPIRRIWFDDTDDYAQYSASPPSDPWAIELGADDGSGGRRLVDFRLPDNYFAGWTVHTRVTFVDPENPTLDLNGSATSSVRAIHVQITRTWGTDTQELVSLRRVFAYVPPL